MDRYERNDLYISPGEQHQINNFRTLLGGCGIGGNIAECALRMGFEQFTVVDGDTVELTNLNRQNYVLADLARSKAEALKRRLLDINPQADIIAKDFFLNGENLDSTIAGHKAAINALDFQSDVPFRFDQCCQQRSIPVLHPYNIGWATLVFVIMPDGMNLSTISSDHRGFEKKIAAFLIDRLQGQTKQWLTGVLSSFEKKGEAQSPPQLSVGSWLAAATCANILFKLATGKSVRAFPEFYFVTMEQ